MQRTIENMRPTFLFIYENFLRLWFVIQSIITGIRLFAPKINDYLWDFNIALHGDYEDVMRSPPSPKKNNNPWCDINSDNIIQTKRKSQDNLIIESEEATDKVKVE